jgi:hypothetical protein
MNNVTQSNYQSNIYEDVIVTAGESINKLKTSKLEADLESKCTICMGKLSKDEMITTLPCNHIYHSECINEYLSSYNSKCPSCRADIRLSD